MTTFEPSTAQRHTARLTLTRRGRAVIVLLAMAILLVVFSLGRVSSQAATPGGPWVAPTTVTVLPGDTLWSIAGRVAPSHDPREVIDAIQTANHLSGVDLQVGQTLRVPR